MKKSSSSTSLDGRGTTERRRSFLATSSSSALSASIDPIENTSKNTCNIPTKRNAAYHFDQDENGNIDIKSVKEVEIMSFPYYFYFPKFGATERNILTLGILFIVMTCYITTCAGPYASNLVIMKQELCSHDYPSLILLLTVMILFRRYLLKPSPLLGQTNEILITREAISRPWSDKLVWTSFIYGIACLYSHSIKQYGLGSLQAICCVGSTLYHLHREAMYFNMDNIFATALLFCTIHSIILAVTIRDYYYLLFSVTGLPLAAFFIIASGMPAEDVICCTLGICKCSSRLEEEGIGFDMNQMEINMNLLELTTPFTNISNTETQYCSVHRNEHEGEEYTGGKSREEKIMYQKKIKGSQFVSLPFQVKENIKRIGGGFYLLGKNDQRGKLTPEKKIKIRKLSGEAYDIWHAGWHVLSGLGTMIVATFYATNFPEQQCGSGHLAEYINSFFEEAFLNSGSTNSIFSCILNLSVPIVPLVCVALATIVNLLGNFYGVMPLK